MALLAREYLSEVVCLSVAVEPLRLHVSLVEGFATLEPSASVYPSPLIVTLVLLRAVAETVTTFPSTLSPSRDLTPLTVTKVSFAVP